MVLSTEDQLSHVELKQVAALNLRKRLFVSRNFVCHEASKSEEENKFRSLSSLSVESDNGQDNESAPYPSDGVSSLTNQDDKRTTNVKSEDCLHEVNNVNLKRNIEEGYDNVVTF